VEVQPTASEDRTHIGRARSTSISELSHIGLQLFVEHGFEATTVDDIATAAGIGRRTFFRYFPSKNDLPWGDFESLITRMRIRLDELDDMPVLDAIRLAVVEFNRFPELEVPYHRKRMELLLNVPTLLAHSTLRYAEWRHVISAYVARRHGVAELTLEPQVIGWSVLAVSLSSYEEWLRHEGADIGTILEAAFEVLTATFSGGA
jgi:mycofactocin system transcriptional regulator